MDLAYAVQDQCNRLEERLRIAEKKVDILIEVLNTLELTRISLEKYNPECCTKLSMREIVLEGLKRSG